MGALLLVAILITDARMLLRCAAAWLPGVNQHNPAAFTRAMPVLFVLLWSTGFIGAKFGLPYAPPLKFLLWRFAIVITLMGAVALATRAAWPRGAQLAHVTVAGVLLQAGYLGGVFAAISLGMTAGLSALIVSMQPVLTAFAGPLFGERVSRRQWLGFVLGLGGVLMVVENKLDLGVVDGPSLWLTVLALLSITAGTIYQKRFCGAPDLRTQSVVQFAAAGAVLLPLSLAFETQPVVWSGEFMSAIGWLVIVLSLGRFRSCCCSSGAAPRRHLGVQPDVPGARGHGADGLADVRRNAHAAGGGRHGGGGGGGGPGDATGRLNCNGWRCAAQKV